LSPRAMKSRVATWVKKRLAGTGNNNVSRGALSHRKLEGLTTGWYHLFMIGGEEQQRNSVNFAALVAPERDPVRFLEPSVRLAEWFWPRRADEQDPKIVKKREPIGMEVWKPTDGGLPTPVGNWAWVQTASVFMKGKEVVRRITNKEKSQILDVREDWGAKIAAGIWGTGDPLPCRIPAEMLRLVAEWAGTARAEPAHGIPEADLIMDPRAPESYGLVERSVAGLFWEPSEDTSLWAVGGPGEKMEKAR
jgi:hypothetical protein